MSIHARQVCILGGGPAGLSCALWAHNLGLEPTLVEPGRQCGGSMLMNFLPNNWVLGQPARPGPDLVMTFLQHVVAADVPILLDSRPTRIERRSDGCLQVTLDTPHGLSGMEAGAVVIATGTRFRAREALLGVPGFNQCDQGRMRFGPYCFSHLEAIAGKRLLIIGGGDNALENACLAQEQGTRVVVAARSAFHAQARFMEKMQAASDCGLHAHTRLKALRPAPTGLLATLEGPQGSIDIEVDRLHLLAGYQPNSGFLADVLGRSLAPPATDADGYLIVDAMGRCSEAGFYAAGDICNRVFPSVVTAIAEGARAAKAIETDLSAPR